MLRQRQAFIKHMEQRSYAGGTLLRFLRSGQ